MEMRNLTSNYKGQINQEEHSIQKRGFSFLYLYQILHKY